MRIYLARLQFPQWSGLIILKRTLSLKPSIRTQWFYATDVPTMKPDRYKYKMEKEPSKFIPFSEYDTKNLERSYHKLKQDSSASAIVDVNEDKLFQVDLNSYLLSPTYWEGPIYEVRRGTWFTSEGLPLNQKLAQAIEDNYHKIKPFNFKDTVVTNNSSTSEEIIKKFDEIKGFVQSDQIDLSAEKDIIEFEDHYILFYDEKYAAIFPKELSSTFQLRVIREVGSQAIPLVKVQYIQRGFSDDLTETVFDSISTKGIPAVSELFENDIFNILGSSNKTLKKEELEKQKEDDMEKVMESDFHLEVTSKEAERDIEHLVLCIHGIGQVLGDQYESVNFTHSVNVMRKTMKKVYQSDDRYKKLAYPQGKESSSNNKIQVLPIAWRHKVDFDPHSHFKDVDENGDHIYPSLSDLTIDGVRPLRNVVGDVLLDILLYYEPRYVEQIYKTVTEELNLVYKLYKEKNPNFNGKVHIMGHSLGSAISFDILSLQTDKNGELDLSKDLAFDVENLFCVGCPVGAFNLLKQRKVVSRLSLPKTFDPRESQHISAPKCKNLYNVFHPCDPVGYRLEPLINPVLAKYKPENILFATEGFTTGLASLSGDITERLQQASKWFTKKKSEKKSGDKIEDEDALGDIVSSLVVNRQPKKESSVSKKEDLKKINYDEMVGINRTGRVDYSLPMGVFDISLVSAISAHVSYFDDENTAGFLMKEILTSEQPPVDSISVHKRN